MRGARGRGVLRHNPAPAFGSRCDEGGEGEGGPEARFGPCLREQVHRGRFEQGLHWGEQGMGFELNGVHACGCGRMCAAFELRSITHFQVTVHPPSLSTLRFCLISDGGGGVWGEGR